MTISIGGSSKRNRINWNETMLQASHCNKNEAWDITQAKCCTSPGSRPPNPSFLTLLRMINLSQAGRFVFGFVFKESLHVMALWHKKTIQIYKLYTFQRKFRPYKTTQSQKTQYVNPMKLSLGSFGHYCRDLKANQYFSLIVQKCKL